MSKLMYLQAPSCSNTIQAVVNTRILTRARDHCCFNRLSVQRRVFMSLRRLKPRYTIERCGTRGSRPWTGSRSFKRRRRELLSSVRCGSSHKYDELPCLLLLLLAVLLLRNRGDYAVLNAINAVVCVLFKTYFQFFLLFKIFSIA